MEQYCQPASYNDVLSGFYIPPQPTMIEELRQAGPDLSVIADIIAKDPGIAAQVLIRVNSPIFGLRNRIASVQQASVLLGLDSVLNVVRLVLLRSVSEGIDPIRLDQFWQNASNVAFTLSLLSKELNIGSPDDAFTLGLFHNCGIPLIAQKYPDYWETLQKAYASTEAPLTQAEDDRINSNHAVVSYLVATAWRLPEHLCLLIRDHHFVESHMFTKANSGEQAGLLAILKMAEHICQLFKQLGGQDQDHEWQRIRPDVLECVGLYEYDYLDLKENIRERLDALLDG